MQNYLILILLVILTIHHHPLSVDVNECELNMDDCSDLAICSNAVGGFTCSCLVGYSGNGRECVSELCKIIFHKSYGRLISHILLNRNLLLF